jgi:hypothetical protein
MSTPASTETPSAVVVPAAAKGAGDMAAVVQNGQAGGGVISPLPYAGGKRRSRKLSKKVLKMLKKMGPSKVAKMIKKGGNTMGAEGTGMEGGRRHGRKTRRHSRRRY